MAATNIAADGNYSTISVSGGDYELWATGTFGSGTLSLQRSDDGTSNWITIGVAGNLCQLTANGTIGGAAGPCSLRINMAGSTSPNVNAGIRRINPSGGY